VSLKLGFAGKDYGYAIDLGLPVRSSSHFARDPEIKAESQWVGSKIEITSSDGYFEMEKRQHGLLRPLKAAELSDGTLRYLLLIAALLSPRPPDLMILNEPETSLHPDLLPPLARLIAQAAQRAQIIVVSHAEPLVSALAKDPRAQRIVLEKQLGETLVQPDERPSWTWPTR